MHLEFILEIEAQPGEIELLGFKLCEVGNGLN